MTKEIEEWVTERCNLGRTVELNGIAKGLQGTVA